MKKLETTISFGNDKVSLTGLHNQLIPFIEKINELVEAINKLENNSDKCRIQLGTQNGKCRIQLGTQNGNGNTN